jgi:probable phosphoglycerate mutase
MPSLNAADPKTIFYLMRHAPTEWNVAGRIQGQADSPLTPAGKQWAQGWGAQLADLALQRVLSSDTGRAVATARHINQILKLPMERDARLREQDWGAWTGHTMADLRTTQRARFSQEEARGWSFCPPEGENHLAVLARAREALMDAGRKWPRQRLLVVTHEGVLKCLVYHLAILQNCGQPIPRMAPYGLHRLALAGNSLALERMNALAFQPRPSSRWQP